MISTRRLVSRIRLDKSYGTRLYTRGRGPKVLSEIDAKADFVKRNEALVDLGIARYPLLKDVHSTAPVVRIPDVRRSWLDVATHDEIPQTPRVQVQGRISAIRRAGKGLMFLDLTQDFTRLQVVVNSKRLDSEQSSADISALLRRGDSISVEGHAWKSKSGEFSILAATAPSLLTPCLHPLPTTELSDATRLHNRVVDLAINPDARDILRARSTVLQSIRRFFEDRDFVEVQTPILSGFTGGANAEPFTTTSRALAEPSQDAVQLSMRISPELWLKRLVVSGFDRVFELGPCFRNEGIDATHNPEFTSCEFYQSYTALPELINLTQDLLKGIVRTVQEKYPGLNSEALAELDRHFQSPLRQIDFISEIEAATGSTLPEDLGDRDALVSFCRSASISISQDQDATPAKLLDHLASKYIEPQCTAPTFVVNHPAVMAPLAKAGTEVINGIPRLVSRRFELFIAGREYVNAYEEENSPEVQTANFKVQAADHLADAETPLPDLSYVSALEWGLPPTGGWGMGVDRLCMLLTGANRIAQVLSFGTVKTVNYQ